MNDQIVEAASAAAHAGWMWRCLMTKLWMRIAWSLPRTLVMWCAVRVGAHATTGKYGSTVVPDLTFMDALQRWDGNA